MSPEEDNFRKLLQGGKAKIKNFDDLVKTYPELFTNSHFRLTETGQPLFYFQCNEGWLPLLTQMCSQIFWKLNRYREVVEIKKRVISEGGTPLPWTGDYFKKQPIDPLTEFCIAQIKEKFGTLRFYVDYAEGTNDEDRGYCDGVIALGESMSYTICEMCGAPGKVGGRGWIQTLCEQHQKGDPKQETQKTCSYKDGSGVYCARLATSSSLCAEHEKVC